MEFIICDTNKREKQGWPKNASMDFDIGELNDVEITCPKGILDFGMWIICPGTEYGALIEENENITTENTEIWRGNALRKFLQQFIIIPPSGQDYMKVTGDAHDIMRQILNGAFEGLFSIPSEPSGIIINNYRFDRYTDALSGFNKMLGQQGAKISLKICQGEPNTAFNVILSAESIKNLSAEIEYSEDSKIAVALKESRRGINHLICLGQGELKNRLVVHLYVQFDGSIARKQYYTGLKERTAVYDYPNAENESELISNGTEELKSLMGNKEMQMSVNNMDDMQIGDIIAGRNYEKGMYMQKPIVRKIVMIKGHKEKIEYKVEGEE